MIFKSVCLDNFGCIESFHRELGRGILVLAGQNGMGKSTVLKAILLAVFDDYQGVLSDYVKWGTKEFRVAVGFSHRGVDYESVVRYDGASDRTLSFNGTTLKGDEAKRRLREIVDVDLLKAGMLSMEQRIAIVETKPAERREYLKRIYDIGFKRQLSDLDEEIKAARVELAGKESAAAEIEGRSYDVPPRPEYPFTEAECAKRRKSLDEERRRLHAAEDAERERARIESDARSLSEEADRLGRDIARLDARAADAERELEALPAKKIAEQSECRARAERLESELSEIGARHEKRKAEIDATVHGLAIARLPAFDKDGYERAKGALCVKRSRLDELRSAKDVCPACGQSISSPEHIARRKAEIAELESETKALSAEVASLDAERARREEAEKSNARVEDARRAAAEALKSEASLCAADERRVNDGIAAARKELSWLDEKYGARKSELRGAISQCAESRGGMDARLADARRSLDAARARLLDTRAEPMDAIRAAIAALEADIRSWDDVSSRVAEIERMEARAAERKAEDRLRLDGLRGEIQALNRTIGDREEGVRIFKTDFPVYVISRVIRDIERSMNDFLKLTYPRYSIEIHDRRGALHIVYGPKKRDVSSASGFERQIFSLSFMFAVSRAIGNKCMILDEADSSATDRNSEIFYRTLGDSIGRGVEQVILVSHKQATRDILQFDYGADVVTFDGGAAS